MDIVEQHRTGATAVAASEPRSAATVTDDSRRLLVLVVEDDSEDRELIRRAFEDCVNDVELKCVRDGDEAYDYLFRFGHRSRGSRQPCLILLDLNVPGMRGETLLREVRNDPVLRMIPIVIFTGSISEADVRRCYDLGANTYFTKPSSIEGYLKVMRTLEAYWLRRAELP